MSSCSASAPIRSDNGKFGRSGICSSTTPKMRPDGANNERRPGSLPGSRLVSGRAASFGWRLTDRREHRRDLVVIPARTGASRFADRVARRPRDRRAGPAATQAFRWGRAACGHYRTCHETSPLTSTRVLDRSWSDRTPRSPAGTWTKVVPPTGKTTARRQMSALGEADARDSPPRAFDTYCCHSSGSAVDSG